MVDLSIAEGRLTDAARSWCRQAVGAGERPRNTACAIGKASSPMG